MPGLIPLMLASGERNSGIFQQQQQQQQQQPATGHPSRGHTRSASLGSSSFKAPVQKAAGQSTSSRRVSQPLPPALPVIPLTHAEWRREISEIKRVYASRRYRACATRCNEILDHIKDASQVEPTYLIYLHFYAANAAECSRPLLSTSPYRSILLSQARTHYDRAAALIQAAEDSVATKLRLSSPFPSRASSCPSPSYSVSSRGWTADSASSPTTSVGSFEDVAAKSHSPQRKRVKKVSFSLPEAPEPFRIQEPIVRPDSPTLGFDDEYFHIGRSLQDLPALPKPKVPDFQFPLPSALKAPLEHRPSRMSFDHLADEDVFASDRSLFRYRDHLNGLRSQLESHQADLDAMSGSLAREPMTAVDVVMSKQSSNEEDLRLYDRQARIDRLRKSGWQRKRFDAGRYERLRETVLAELVGCDV